MFHDLAVESFRHNRFGKHFTHLKYDCRKKWAYDYMPAVVGIALAVLVVFNVFVFLLRKRFGCDKFVDEVELEDSDQAQLIKEDKKEDQATKEKV